MKKITALVLLAVATACGEAPTAAVLEPPGAPTRDFVSEGCTGIICGPNYIYLSSESMEVFTWTASPTSGTAPYSYAWNIHYDLHGSGPLGQTSSSVSFGVNSTDSHFTLEVTVRDATNTVVHHEWHRVLVCDTSTFC